MSTGWVFDISSCESLINQSIMNIVSYAGLFLYLWYKLKGAVDLVRIFVQELDVFGAVPVRKKI